MPKTKARFLGVHARHGLELPRGRVWSSEPEGPDPKPAPFPQPAPCGHLSLCGGAAVPLRVSACVGKMLTQFWSRGGR